MNKSASTEGVAGVDRGSAAEALKEHDYDCHSSPLDDGARVHKARPARKRASESASRQDSQNKRPRIGAESLDTYDAAVNNDADKRTEDADEGIGVQADEQCELNGALERIQQLKQTISKLSLTGPLSKRWCLSDEDFKYFTRFPSKDVFYVFWASVEPSASMSAYWSEANRIAALPEAANLELTPEHELPLIDEFFMFCLHLSAGMKDRVLAGMFGVSRLRVIQTIVTWSNYLYLVLGSVRIWMTRAQVRKTMAPIIRQYCLCTRVILACAELRCEIGEMKTSSETLLCKRKCVTYKALVGIAPCGFITFVSKLFSDSISNDELTRLSGILKLLEPGDEVIAPKNFCIDNLLKNVGAKLVAFPVSSEDGISSNQRRARSVARLHALVEYVIKRIKGNKLLDSTIPYTLAGTVNQIWSCCCFMANYRGQ
ncbi:PREDICTED: uncharacterized protein LOC106930517 isoform X1 [Poecilia mexicana]|uniref:uncharacterized protein LOC106930517 isoform X1 n=1 Tax=Poecilia mexicana TaxID=48701 RepID=UPI00072ED07F|nr:PREDICTED: uncharacterized protein LOC106930517 isoform X1 [Poecilia mexicana]